MTEGPKVVVVAHPRSGSNTLVEILRCHPDLTILNEPFNERFTSWLPANPEYRDRVTDVDALDRVVDEILARYSGFKLHTYQLDFDLLAHLLLRADLHVIFLRRHNLLEAAVSNMIAVQTELWKAWDRDRPLRDYYTDLDDLPVEDLRRMVGWNRQSLDQVTAVLASRSDGRALEVSYEDLLLAELSTHRAVVDALWAHLGLTACRDPRVQRFLKSSEFRMAGSATYGHLPNLAEIEAALGSDDTGHITYLPATTSPAVDG